MVTDLSPMSWQQTVIFLSPVVAIVAYEFSLGVVRVQDYFRAHYLRYYITAIHSHKTALSGI